MFQGRRRKGLKRAIEEAGDREVRELKEEVAFRQDRIAQLELDLFDTRAELALFEREYEERLGLLSHRRRDLEELLHDARRSAARKAQWGQRSESDDMHEDVVDQFQRKWRQNNPGPLPPKQKSIDEESAEELKGTFRMLAKRFHPDLAKDSQEREWREQVMAEVNEAYNSGDLATLESIGKKPDYVEPAPTKTRDGLISDLYEEIKRLDGVIGNLEMTLKNLVNSQTVKLMLEASIAKTEGRDLLADMEDALKIEIRRLEDELNTMN
ncbi:MAG: hypothetical protein GTO18_15860 [Anaerolineales bacterium]|nr:hypothetical protein [Anaerolineales bacterium]